MSEIDHLDPTDMLELPMALREGIAAALAEVPSPRWLRAAQGVSERYRAERSGGETALARGEDQALGYAALILPAAYAQLRGAMAATAARLLGWEPRTMLDLGSGPGTALWAASAQWPSLEHITAWEREPALIALGRKLAASGPAALQASRWERHDLRELAAEGPQYDLVVIGHVLNELEPELRQRLIAAAWARAGGLLLVVEPGTSGAFEIVRESRNALLDTGARTIAPCPHDLPCPLTNDWCHFPQRLRRPDFQKRARGAPSAWEDAKYSYAAMARFGPSAPIAGRVIREPAFNKAYAETLLCAAEGVAPLRALKRHREAFRRVKNLVWGEALEEGEASRQ
jgi:ribosomal protein RSM22 (predicted rRNA methylase)